MTSKIKVDNINKVSDDSNIIKKCGSTTTVGSGSGTIVVDGSTVTLGRCGGTVALASGATQTGFGRTGTVDWQTSIKTSTITAVNGEGYFVNTTGGAITANLPAGSAGAIVAFRDYANTFDSNKLTISANGSEKINGDTTDLTVSTEGESLTLVYADATKGWLVVNDGNNDAGAQTAFVVACGGNTTATCGNYKIHTFTGPGTFTVTCAGNACGSNTLDYLVVAGGAGGAGEFAGSGAGGYRESVPSPAAWTGSPLANPGGGLTASATAYPIVVGAGGAANSNNGNNSTFSTITSNGGGAGTTGTGNAGGSGGGGAAEAAPNNSAGSGNSPPVSPPQGQPGGAGANCGGNPRGGGGGGGATAAGSAGSPSNSGNGGAGATSSITGSPVARAGGGGGGGNAPSNNTIGTGGTGGGGGSPGGPLAGTANTGGGGAAFGRPSGTGGNGGSGVVIIRYKFQ